MEDVGHAPVIIDKHGSADERAKQNTGYELEAQNEDL